MTLKIYVDNFILFFPIVFVLYLSVGYSVFMTCPLIDKLWITRGPFENLLFIRILVGGLSRVSHRLMRKSHYFHPLLLLAPALDVSTLRILRVLANWPEGGERPCSREDILLGFLNDGWGPERN